MKAVGRKTSSAYELYGFIPKVENGKHSAICMACNRVLRNTAGARLQKHRNSCFAYRASGGDPVHFGNLEIKNRLKSKVDTVQQDEIIKSYVKKEHSHIDFEDINTNDNANYNTTYENGEESCEALDHQENPIQLPDATQQQSAEPFDPYRIVANTTITSDPVTDDEMQNANDEDFINIEEELDVIKNLMPRSKASKQLQDELSKAETEYYRCKAAYFTKLTENCKIKRTLMLLESRKLQIEIEKLTNEL